VEKPGKFVLLAGTMVLAATALLFGGERATRPVNETPWPTKGNGGR